MSIVQPSSLFKMRATPLITAVKSAAYNVWIASPKVPVLAPVPQIVAFPGHRRRRSIGDRRGSRRLPGSAGQRAGDAGRGGGEEYSGVSGQALRVARFDRAFTRHLASSARRCLHERPNVCMLPNNNRLALMISTRLHTFRERML